MSYVGGQAQPPLSYAQIYQLALKAGFPPGEAAVKATAIAQAESGGVPNNFNPTDPHGGSTGLMQINGANAHLIGGANWVNAGTDPMASMQAAFALSKGGTDFTPWGSYTNGSYNKFLKPAASAAAAPGQGGVGGDYAASARANAAAPIPPSAAPPNFATSLQQGDIGGMLAALNAPGAGGQTPANAVGKVASDLAPPAPASSSGAQPFRPQSSPMMNRNQALMAPAQQILATVLASSAKPVSWNSAPPGSPGGISLAGQQQTPGITLNSIGAY